MTRRSFIIAAVLLMMFGAAAWFVRGPVVHSKAADEDETQSAVSPPPRVTVQNGITVLSLSAATQRNGGIETAHPDRAAAQEYLVGYGTVLDPAALTNLENNYLEARAQVQTADARLAVSRAAFERAHLLHSDPPAISMAQLQSAQGSFLVDQAMLDSAQSRLTALAASARQAWGPVVGQALIDRRSLITSLIDRREYLVKVTLSPGARMAAPPQTATVNASDGSDITLRFVSQATMTEPKLQGASYLYMAAAESDLLPGLNLIVSLPRAQESSGLAVPESAVVWLQGKAWVYLRTGPETFVRREIAPDHPATDGGYIVAGLASDAQVAVRGAQMLLSEEFRAQVRGDQDLD